MNKQFFSKKILTLTIVAAVIFGIGGYYLYARKFSVLPDAATTLMQQVHEPVATDKVLIISPHFDDETITSGGYIQRALKNKAEVKIIAVTDGNRRGIGSERHKEFVEVTKTLGVDQNQIEFLNLPEFYLKEKISQNSLDQMLESDIKNFNPTVIIYPDIDDKNPDHNYIGRSVDGLILHRDDIYAYTYLVHWKYFPQPVGLHPNRNLMPPVKMLDFSHNWQRFDLSSSEEDAKLSALLIYKSQLRIPLLHDLLVSMVRKNELFSIKKSSVNITQP